MSVWSLVEGRGGAAGGMITRIGSLASALRCCLFEINLTTHDLAGLGLCLDMSLCLSAPATGILLGINKYVKQAFLCISCMQPLWKIPHCAIQTHVFSGYMTKMPVYLKYCLEHKD